MTEGQQHGRARRVTYCVCLFAIAFLIVVGTIGDGGHG